MKEEKTERKMETITIEALKFDEKGLIPAVVVDAVSKKVLTVAYMNEEAYNTTLRTGKMTYWSRSRNELWTKGLTSGHVQYVKSLTIDCDNDTILAKVEQVGAACHTGNRSCFYRVLEDGKLKEQKQQGFGKANVLYEVTDVIKDRRKNPKEGSYTNYLFDKGIDKILKKVGEEASEVIIGAKNASKEEVQYEVADLLYHLMVMLVERGVELDDIFTELENRK